MQLWLVLLSVLTLSLTLTDGQNTPCGNDFKTLEKALLLTGNNKVELLKAFYPPRLSPATFVTVHYTFLDLVGNITCQKTWLWSSVDFYLIQPPSIFQFMSLLFTIPLDRSITTANITFPGDCQNLVTNENKSCTCISNGLLDILTQRLKLYAKVNSHYEIKIDDASLGTAVCEDEHETKYNDESTTISLSCGIVIPIFLILLLVMIVWSSRAKITAAMNKEQNHANLAAFALTGLVFSTFTVVLDVWALVLVVQESHEFNQHTNFTSLTFVIITTVFDAAIVLAAYFMLLYLRCLVCCRKEHKPTRTLWVIASTCIAPLFCLTSHSGYIIMACMSDPRYPGLVTYIYIISFFYYFIIFRQLYNLWSKVKPVSCPELHLLQCCCVQLRYCCKKLGENYSKINNEEQQQQRTVFNHSVFFIEIWLSVFLVGAEVFVLDSFVTLPVTLAAPTDVYFAQLAVVIITALFAYNFIYTEDRHTQFMKAFVETFIYRNKCLSIDNLPNAEKAGKVLGGLAFAITRQYTEDESKQLLEAFAANYNATDPDLHVANNAEAVGKVFGKLAFRIKHTDGLMEAFVINFKETNPEALRLDEQIKLEDAETAGRMLGGLAFTIMDKCTENEPKQLVKAFVENFNNPNLHPDEPNHAQAATMVLGGLAFKIMQEHRPNDINPGDESRKLEKVFIDTFKELHLTSLNNAKAAGMC